MLHLSNFRLLAWICLHVNMRFILCALSPARENRQAAAVHELRDGWGFSPEQLLQTEQMFTPFRTQI